MSISELSMTMDDFRFIKNYYKALDGKVITKQTIANRLGLEITDLECSMERANAVIQSPENTVLVKKMSKSLEFVGIVNGLPTIRRTARRQEISLTKLGDILDKANL